MSQNLKGLKRKRVLQKQISHLAVIFGALLIFFAGWFILWVSALPLPDFETFEERKIAQSTKIYDRTGEILLYDIHGQIKRRIIPYEEISLHIRNATVAIEDSEFYEHRGVRVTAIFRAFLVNLVSVRVEQGGSTITQQVIKNTLLSKEKKLSRKIKEAVLALKLEKLMSKDDILTLYLNDAPYGGSVYGVEEASQAFFGKSATDVSLAEASYLAALPKAPTYYSPHGEHVPKLLERKNIILGRMVELGFISESERNRARLEQVTFLPPQEKGIKAPHFVMFVREHLEDRYGVEAVETGGFKVITTLDWEMQKKAEEVVTRFGAINAETFNAKNAGLVAIDPKTGHILAMVGSRNYFDIEGEGNFNVTLGHRQPGSAFKPFVYATAFKRGYTPETIVFDVQTQFSTECTPEGVPLGNASPEACYTPGNFDDIFRGPITFRNALAQSINVPAVKVLYLAGIKESLETARDMGITTLTDPNRYGLTLVLGGGEVTLLELTGAYGVFANDGIRNISIPIIEVKDQNGATIEVFDLRPERAVDENIARQISDILSDNRARAPAFGDASPLYVPERQVAAKTGTTNYYQDVWTVGYTPSLVVGTWAGNNDGSSMEKRVAGFIIAPMWRAFMDAILPSLPVEKFSAPEQDPGYESLKPVLRGMWRGGENYFLDKVSKKLATEYTPPEVREEHVVTEVHSILYWLDKSNPRGGRPGNPVDDPQFNLWEPWVRKWAFDHGIVDETKDTIPKETDDIHTPDNTPRVSVIKPLGGASFGENETILVSVNAVGKFPITQTDYYLNGVFLGSRTGIASAFSFVPNESGVSPGVGELLIRVFDSVRNQGESRIPITITI